MTLDSPGTAVGLRRCVSPGPRGPNELDPQTLTAPRVHATRGGVGPAAIATAGPAEARDTGLRRSVTLGHRPPDRQTHAPTPRPCRRPSRRWCAGFRWRGPP